MAGRGPAPKDPSRRARRNDDGVTRTRLPLVRAAQPDLPQGADRWPARTREWWQTWRESPIAADFTAVDWEFLLETALLHARFWGGDSSVAGELRLRVAKFGATPEDRMRLRIDFVDVEPPPADAPTGRPSARYADLRVLPGGGGDAVAGS